MKPHYFDNCTPDPDDLALKMAIAQGYVPPSCVLGGAVVMAEVTAGRDPCATCRGPRHRCEGRPFGGASNHAPAAIRRFQSQNGHNDRFFFLGVDSAPSETQRSDDGGIVGAVATPRNIEARMSEAQKIELLSDNEADWFFDYIYAKRLTYHERASARQYSGLIHQLHKRFGYERILMDYNGGGVFVKRELKEPKQLINGVLTEVTPIGDQLTGPIEIMGGGNFILHMFKRGDPGIELLWPKLPGDENLNDASYSIMKEGIDTGIVAWPAPVSHWLGPKKEETRGWSEERLWCAKNLQASITQFNSIVVQVKEDGITPFFTKRNARIFEARGKKDLASAAMYCYIGFLIWLRSGEWQSAMSTKDRKQFSGW